MAEIIDRVKRGEGAPQRSAGAKARAKGQTTGLYKPRTPIYPKQVHGPWRRLKWALLVAMLGIYYLTPWIRWPRPAGLPDQAVLVDFAGGRFYLFGLQLWPQEVHFITGLLVMSALGLFLVTALFGRVWCGYACPQTVWTDLYIFVERLFEGDRNTRMRRDAQPWSLDKAWRKAGKHLVWLGIAFGTGGAWIFYFHDAFHLIRTFWIGQAPATAYIFCALLTATTYAFAGTMREQVCIYMCPWPRIQGAMLDQHSLQVTYRYDRGEPRGPHKKGEGWAGRGDCVDCNACFNACPMGIDIRDGAQIECINCALCIDACDEIMVKVERPAGLIGFDTDAAVAARAAGKAATYRFARGRSVFYAVALAALAGLMGWGLAHRSLLDVHVLRDRSPQYVMLRDGSIRDGYTLKISNRSFEPLDVSIGFSGVAGARLNSPGREAEAALVQRVEPNETRPVRVFVTVRPDAITDPNMPARFEVSAGREHVSVATHFQSALRGAP